MKYVHPTLTLCFVFLLVRYGEAKTDQEMTVIEKVVFYSQFPGRGACHTTGWERGTRGGTSVGQEAEEALGICDKRLYCSFYGKDQVRQGEQAQDWLI